MDLRFLFLVITTLRKLTKTQDEPKDMNTQTLVRSKDVSIFLWYVENIEVDLTLLLHHCIGIRQCSALPLLRHLWPCGPADGGNLRGHILPQ